MVVLEPDVARAFPNAKAVNSSLRALAQTSAAKKLPSQSNGTGETRREVSPHFEGFRTDTKSLGTHPLSSCNRETMV